MKRFTFYLLALSVAHVAFSLVVDWLNVALIRSSSGNSACKMERLYANPEPDEIAIVGSSRALGNYVPSIISPQCFNYGENGMHMGEILPILRVLKDRSTTAPVILNIDPWGVRNGSDVADYRLAPQSGKVSGCERIPGIRFFGKLRQNLVAYVDARRSVTRVIDCGAQLLKNSWTKDAWVAINAKIGKINFSSDPEVMDDLLNVLRSFAPRRVYIVIGPCSSYWTQQFQGRYDLENMIESFRSIPNVEVIDLFAASQFNDDDFVDPTHFNISGARKFSTLLKDRLHSRLSRRSN